MTEEARGTHAGGMSAPGALRIALRAMGRNKLRALLTTLGVLIGVGAVIAMMAAGAGAKARVEEAFASMGTNMLVLLPGYTSTGGVKGGFGSMPTVTWEDLASLRVGAPSVRAAAPELRASVTLVATEANWTSSVTGTSPEFFEIRSWPVARGVALAPSDVDAATKVIVLGQTAADKLYQPGVDPVGQTLRIGSTPFLVIGVAARKGQSGMGQDLDDAAFVPYTTYAQKIQGGLGKYVPGAVLIAATSAASTRLAQEEVEGLLRERHHIPAGSPDDFSIRDLGEVASAQAKGAETMTLLLASVAAVSLLVGGIGIMNIMLVSVTERTREIGIRMAVGAQPRDILTQFLIEALALSVTGGLLGVLAGVGAAWLLSIQFHWPMRVQPDVIAASVGFSAVVGLAFGLYPARVASQLDPIDALRFE